MIPMFLILYFGLMLLFGTPLIYTIVIAVLSIPIFFGTSTLELTTMVEAFVQGSINTNTGLTILLFILAGELMSRGQLTERIFNVFAYFLGKKKGFMPILSIATCMFYGAISGSGPATTAAVGAMCYPMLVQMGYDRIFSAAILVTAGCLGMVIPPSVPLTGVNALSGGLDLTVLYAVSAVVGVVAGFLIILYAYFYCLRKGNGDQKKINAWVDSLRSRGFASIIKESIWALLTPVIILGSIFSGLADTAEAAALSLIYAVFVSLFIYKTSTFKDVIKTLKKSAINGAPMLIMLSFAQVFSTGLAATNLANVLTNGILGNNMSPTILMCTFCILMLIMGCVNGLNWIQLLPLLFPIMVQTGLEPFTCCVALVLTQAIGLCTPPIGLCLFVMQPMAKCSIGELGKAMLPYLAILVILVFILVLCPGLFEVFTANGYVPGING
ncbi:TRAP transporter large permease [Hominifimenecus sp. rT4P-3]|uniref:TRAP transporter large permease n=1 Tax=Hominifimenecus sp. rT4P-3 TaxID=3242979 RepID=UPI003DA3FA45